MMGADMGGRYELHACGWICRGGVTQGRLECGLSIYPARSGVKAECPTGCRIWVRGSVAGDVWDDKLYSAMFCMWDGMGCFGCC